MNGGEQNGFRGRYEHGGPGGTQPPGIWLADSAEGLDEPLAASVMATHEQPGPCVLVLADDPALGDWLLEELRQAGATAAVATNGRDGLALLRSGVVDVLISEMGLPDLPGIELLRTLPSLTKIPKVILTTSRQSEFLARRAIENGASAVVSKPFRVEQLLAIVARLLGH